MKHIKNFINETLNINDKKIIDKCVDQFNNILTDDPDNIEEFLYYFLDETSGGGSDDIVIGCIKSWLEERTK